MLGKKTAEIMNEQKQGGEINEYAYVNRASTAQVGFYAFDETFTNVDCWYGGNLGRSAISMTVYRPPVWYVDSTASTVVVHHQLRGFVFLIASEPAFRSFLLLSMMIQFILLFKV